MARGKANIRIEIGSVIAARRHMSIEYLSKNWEELAREDPLWAVLTDPAKKGGQWDPEEFMKREKTMRTVS